MIVMKPVVEVNGSADFALWPVSVVADFSFQPLHGGLTPAEVGTAVLAIASANRIRSHDGEDDDRAFASAAALLQGLLTPEDLVAFGGLQVTDTGTGVVFNPACCDGLESWRDWYAVPQGGELWYGHPPLSPHADGNGRSVRLTVDAEDPASAVIELTHGELERLLAGVERDLADFRALAAAWAAERLPEGYAEPVAVALARLFAGESA
ncbi:hypothetical protein ACWCYY_06535 [Kitasatospora sp. NPDC001664]